MATYFTDFSEYTTGVQPSDWTKRWDADAAWAVQEVAGTTGGKVNRFSITGDGQNFLSWDAIDADVDRDDVEMVARFRFLSPETDQELNLSARGSGASNNKTCYDGGVRARGTDLVWHSKFNANTYALIDSVGATFANDTWYWLRVRMIGTSIKTRFWVDGDSEPATWTLENTDTAITAAGWVGFRTFWDGDLEVDLFGVGTNGDTAPTSAATSQTVVVGKPVETDAATNMVLARTELALQALEESNAWAVTAKKTRAALQATELTSATAVVISTAKTALTAQETDTAQPVGHFRVAGVGRGTETGVAQPVGHVRGAVVGLAGESSAATSLGHSRAAVVGLASESDTAGSTVATGGAEPEPGEGDFWIIRRRRRWV